MSTILYPLINGVRHSFASIEVKLANSIFFATAVNYSRKRNRTMVRENHPDPVGKTVGENEYTADIEMLLAEYANLQALLIQQASAAGLGTGYGDVAFQVIVTYSSPGMDTVTDTINGCTMDSTDGSNAQGTDPTKRKFEMNPLKILFGGVDDLSVPLAAPTGT